MKSRCQKTVSEIFKSAADRLEAEYEDLKRLSEILKLHRDILPAEAVEILDKLEEADRALQTFSNTRTAA